MNIQREQVEGSGDHANRRIPPSNVQGQRNPRNRNRTRRRNVHLNQHENDADNKYAGRRSDDIRYGLESMRMLVDVIYHGMIEQPRRTVREIVNDIRDLENDRRDALPQVLPDIDMSLEILRRELRSLHDPVAAGANEDLLLLLFL